MGSQATVHERHVDPPAGDRDPQRPVEADVDVKPDTFQVEEQLQQREQGSPK
jgi:hypothetical protein